MNCSQSLAGIRSVARQRCMIHQNTLYYILRVSSSVYNTTHSVRESHTKYGCTQSNVVSELFSLCLSLSHSLFCLSFECSVSNTCNVYVQRECMIYYALLCKGSKRCTHVPNINTEAKQYKYAGPLIHVHTHTWLEQFNELTDTNYDSFWPVNRMYVKLKYSTYQYKT